MTPEGVRLIPTLYIRGSKTGKHGRAVRSKTFVVIAPSRSLPLTFVMQPAKLDSSRLSIQTTAPLRSRLGKYLRNPHFFRAATVRERWSETRIDRQDWLSYLAPRRKVSGIGRIRH